MIDKSESVSVWESVIFIANISVIGISVILHIGAPLLFGTSGQLGHQLDLVVFR